jgi:hypothetical protein
MSTIKQRKGALEELSRIRKEQRELLSDLLLKTYSNDELIFLVNTLWRDDIRGGYYLVHSSGGTGKVTELSSVICDSDPNVLLCPIDEVPLYIKNITEETKANERLAYGVAVWRLKIGK